MVYFVMVVGVVADWDADGVVSAAQVFYSQEVVGGFPLKGREKVFLFPSTVRSVFEVVKEIVDSSVGFVVFLDIAYSKYMDRALRFLGSRDIGILYIDHHISTAIHVDSIKPLVNNIVLGKTSTAMLVYNQLRSVGIDINERLKAFVEAVTAIERGREKESVKQIHGKLIDIVANLSRVLSSSRSRDLWVKVVRWLTEPLPMISMPFASDVTIFAKSSPEYIKELKSVANEIALSSRRIFNIRFVDIRNSRYPYKSTAIASALYRLFKSPIVLLTKNKKGREILIIKSRDTLAYDLGIHLYRKGVTEDIMGHQTLVIMLLKQGLNLEKIIDHVREFIVSGPAGI